MELLGSISRAFHLISSEYGWDDEVILDKSLRRIRQIIAAIAEDHHTRRREQRLIASWQTRSLAMVMAAGAASPSEEVMQFAANLTIDNEEYQAFGEETKAVVKSDPKVPVHAMTQEEQVTKNYEAAADRNNIEMMGLFGMKLSEGKPGHD